MKITNHQQLIIEKMPDALSPVFQITDAWGQKRTIHEFAITSLRVEETEHFLGLSDEDQKTYIHELLEHYMRHAASHDIHIESVNGLEFVRFGDYGLPGGAKDDEPSEGWSDGRFLSHLASSIKVGAGIFLLGSGVGTVPGAALISAGVSSMMHTANTDDKDLSFSGYLTNSLIGGGTSLITAGAGGLVTGLAAKAVVGGAVGKTSNVLMRNIADGKEMPSAKELLKAATTGAITGGVASAASNVATEFASDVLSGAAEQIVKTASSSAGGAAGAGASTLVQNIVEGKENLTEGVYESMAVGGTIGGAIGALQSTNAEKISLSEENKQLQQENNLNKEIIETQKEIERLMPEKQNYDAQKSNIQKRFSDAPKGTKFRSGGKYYTREEAIARAEAGHRVEFKGGKTVLKRIFSKGPQRSSMKVKPIDQSANQDYQTQKLKLENLQAQAQAQAQDQAQAQSSSQTPPPKAERMPSEPMMLFNNEKPEEIHEVTAVGADNINNESFHRRQEPQASSSFSGQVHEEEHDESLNNPQRPQPASSFSEQEQEQDESLTNPQEPQAESSSSQQEPELVNDDNMQRLVDAIDSNITQLDKAASEGIEHHEQRTEQTRARGHVIKQIKNDNLQDDGQRINALYQIEALKTTAEEQLKQEESWLNSILLYGEAILRLQAQTHQLKLETFYPRIQDIETRLNAFENIARVAINLILVELTQLSQLASTVLEAYDVNSSEIIEELTTVEQEVKQEVEQEVKQEVEEEAASSQVNEHRPDSSLSLAQNMTARFFQPVPEPAGQEVESTDSNQNYLGDYIEIAQQVFEAGGDEKAQRAAQQTVFRR